MANDEQWIALGKLLASYSLLCDNISGALCYLFGGDPGPESMGILVGYLRPPDQADAALQLLEERSKKGDFSAKTFRDLRDALKKAIDLATNDFRLPGMNFDLALYLDKEPADAEGVRTRFWSCLDSTLEAERIELIALDCFQAAIALIVAVCALRADDERSSTTEESGIPEDLPASEIPS